MTEMTFLLKMCGPQIRLGLFMFRLIASKQFYMLNLHIYDKGQSAGWPPCWFAVTVMHVCLIQGI